MTREIKFRGKRLDNGKWEIGNLVVAQNGAPYIFPPAICEVDGHHLRQGDDTPHRVDPATVGQFTGEFDGDDNEIYEGDFVLYPEPVRDTTFSYPAYVWTRHEVVFDEGCFWLLPTDRAANDPLPLSSLNGSANPQVRGNIHDNPELLKNENQ